MEEQPEERKIIHRAPALPVRISELKEGMGRVALVGTVVSKNPDIQSFMIDDRETQLLCLTNNQEDFNRLKEGRLVRCLGKLMGSQDELELLADIIQDFSKLDLELYKKVFFGTAGQA